MKKIISILSVIIILFSFTSCSKGVTYLKEPSEQDSEMFDNIIEVDAFGEDEVIFHTYETIYKVSVNCMEYNYDTDEYTLSKTVYEQTYMQMSDALKIKLDMSLEVPYVMIRYTRKNDETREQYIYRSPDDNRLWLLERE